MAVTAIENFVVYVHYLCGNLLHAIHWKNYSTLFSQDVCLGESPKLIIVSLLNEVYVVGE